MSQLEPALARVSPGASRHLASRANSEKLQFVGDGFEPVAAGDAFFERRREAVRHFHNSRAFGADQVMMMFFLAVMDPLEPGFPITEVVAADQAEAFQQVHQ